VFQAVHRNDPDPKLLAYQYLQVLPQLAQGEGNTFWVIPSEVTSALQGVSRAFTDSLPRSPATRDQSPTDELAARAAAEDAAKAEEAAAEAVADAAEPDGLPGIGAASSDVRINGGQVRPAPAGD
jgi:regulator of protease activity HflC (stomatin/prohibitin superfamily)